MSDAPKTDGPKLSPVEGVKAESCQLRGTIAAELGVDAEFSHDAATILKHHGTYQQDDRDLRGQKNADGTAKGKSFQMMVRTRIPGGRITAAQFLAELDLCEKYGNGTLRITSRQGLQLHGILKDNLKATIKAINDTMLTTLAACGDVNRNVMCCPAPVYDSPVHAEMQAFTDALAERLKPRTTGYYEIWLKDENGEETNAATFQPVDEPIYGPTYLPRKFKIAVSLPDDNCVDVYTNDLGFLAVVEQGKIVGYNVLVGGGMGMTPSAKKTFPALAKQMAFATPEQALDVAVAVVKAQRDHGNRSDRKVARLKYVIANHGLEWFKARVEEHFGGPLPPPRDVDVTDVDDHLGWHTQGDGRWFLGVNVPNGRLHDVDGTRYKTGIRAILEKYAMDARFTPLQSVLLCNIAENQKADIDRMLTEHGIPHAADLSPLRRYAIACPAWPTCGLSITESERAMPGLLDGLETELAKYGLAKDRISVHMTGCPNGCARPYTPDIGFVGKAAGERYTVYLGGNVQGTRLAYVYADMIAKDDIVPLLSPLFAYYKASRQAGESFGDFCCRQGKEKLEAYSQEMAQAG